MSRLVEEKTCRSLAEGQMLSQRQGGRGTGGFLQIFESLLTFCSFYADNESGSLRAIVQQPTFREEV